MLKPLLITFCLVSAVGASAYVLLERSMPAPADVLYPCLTQEAELSPTHRMLACSCLSTEVASYYWTARDLVLPPAMREAARVVVLNTCRARSFQQAASDRGPTRMSPLPTLRN